MPGLRLPVWPLHLLYHMSFPALGNEIGSVGHSALPDDFRIISELHKDLPWKAALVVKAEELGLEFVSEFDRGWKDSLCVWISCQSCHLFFAEAISVHKGLLWGFPSRTICGLKVISERMSIRKCPQLGNRSKRSSSSWGRC